MAIALKQSPDTLQKGVTPCDCHFSVSMGQDVFGDAAANASTAADNQNLLHGSWLISAKERIEMELQARSHSCNRLPNLFQYG